MARFRSLILLLVAGIATQGTCSDCSICLDFANRATKQGTETEQQTKQRVLDGASAYTGADKTKYTSEVNCHWKKYYRDANQQGIQNLHSTCADTGMCSIQYQAAPTTFTLRDITSTTNNYGTTCTMPDIVLLHHTADSTVDETIKALNSRGLSVQYIVAKNGTVYQQVRDFHRAWHAGVGAWHEFRDVNSNSVGIEIVNTGDEPYPKAQVHAVGELVATLKKRWHVNDHYIAAHGDSAPDHKDDPSGYFPWVSIYNRLSVFADLYNTTLNNAQQHKVIIGANVTYASDTLTKVQNNLKKIGYTYLTLTPGVYDSNTAYVFQAFNRHYSPEIFIDESVDPKSDSTIFHKSNQYWYGISEERLQKLLNYK